MKLTKSQFPDKEWPFTVDTVHVTMKESGPLILLLIRFGLARYALNGTAENYKWKPIPLRYKVFYEYSHGITDNFTVIYLSLTWFIKFCLDNVKKA